MWQLLVQLMCASCIGTSLAAPDNTFADRAISNCTSGVHIVTVRGTGEAQGVGLMGGIARRVRHHIPGSNVIGLRYPASFNPTIQVSEQKGRRNLIKYIKKYVKRCPDARLVLLGYSQGAQVVADTLCGTSEPANGFPENAPLAPELGKHVVASVWYGDPSHIKDLPWDYGTSKRDGEFPRQNTTACEPYADRLRSYCDHGDPVCDSGHDLGVHYEYFMLYDDVAAQFVVSTILSYGSPN